MQLYTDSNGIQTLTSGRLSIDSDTGLPVFPIIWDTEVDGGEIDPTKVGGYSRVNDELVYSQEDFDAHETAKETVTASDLAAFKLALQAEAKKVIDDLRADGIALRAQCKIIMNEVNILRQREVAWLANVAAATSLSDLKTRTAQLTTMDDRTFSQLKTAIINEILSGNSDS